MAEASTASPRGIRLDELSEFALAIAQQVWAQDVGLKAQADERELLAWLRDNFPGYVTKPFGERHIRLWDWFEALTPGVAPDPLVEVWPRGGAKTTTGQMGITRIGYKGTRRFGLVVSETQKQANKYVGTVGNLFGKLGLGRALNQYGQSLGWSRSELRVSNGFNLVALGLDAAVRGIKIDEFRPDIVIFDDIDSQNDSAKTVEDKEESIRSAILPAGSSDCAFLFLQNLIHENGIVARLVNNQAEFLLNRVVSPIAVAVEGLKVESVDRGDGLKVYKIVGGTPTWEGQDLEVCEKQINTFSLKTFLREAQHEVAQADGYFFDHTKFNIVDEIPEGFRFKYIRPWDLAATQGGGDYTAGPLLGQARNGTWWILDLEHDQLSSDRVRGLVKGTAHKDSNQYGNLKVSIPNDPGQAGTAQSEQFEEMLSGINGIEVVLVTPSKAKAVRARGWADAVNSGNVYILRAEWNHKLILQHRKFREDGDHEYDDIIDALADGYNTLAEPSKAVKFTF